MMKKICNLILLRKFVFLGVYCLFAIVFSIIAFSCGEEQLRNDPENFGSEEQEIIFSMNLPSISEATPQLRSIGSTQENTIQTVDLIAFRKDNSTFNYYYEGTLASENTPGTSTQKCRIKVRIERYEQDLVIITNAGTQVKNVVNAIEEGQTISKEAFLAKLEYELTGTGTQWKVISASNYEALPMWGETTATITQNATQLSVSLLRMLAKIEVQLDETKLSDLTKVFKLKSVSLYNTYSKGRIVPNSAVVQKSGNNLFVTAPSIPNNAVKNSNALVYRDFTAPGVPDIAMKGAIYTFETKAPPTTDQYGLLEATYLVIGGIYGTDTQETYYRVDFLDGDKKFKDILRNHRYIVNITSVTGSGYEDPVQAGNDKGTNMDVTILNWDESNMYNVTFDGQWYLSVSRDSIMISKERQDNTELFVITDYGPPDPLHQIRTGWYVESISNNTPKWVDVSPTEGTPNDLKNITISTSENTTGSPRSSTIIFAAGRLRYPVRVYQSLLEKASVTLEFIHFGRNPATILFPIEFESNGQGVLVGKQNPYEGFTVSWTPKNANLVVYKTTVNNVQYSSFNLAPDITGIVTGVNGVLSGVGVAPNAVVQPAEVSGLSFYERGMKLVFSVSNGINTDEKTVILRHVYSR